MPTKHRKNTAVVRWLSPFTSVLYLMAFLSHSALSQRGISVTPVLDPGEGWTTKVDSVHSTNPTTDPTSSSGSMHWDTNFPTLPPSSTESDEPATAQISAESSSTSSNMEETSTAASTSETLSATELTSTDEELSSSTQNSSTEASKSEDKASSSKATESSSDMSASSTTSHSSTATVTTTFSFLTTSFIRVTVTTESPDLGASTASESTRPSVQPLPTSSSDAMRNNQTSSSASVSTETVQVIVTTEVTLPPDGTFSTESCSDSTCAISTISSTPSTSGTSLSTTANTRSTSSSSQTAPSPPSASTSGISTSSNTVSTGSALLSSGTTTMSASGSKPTYTSSLSSGVSISYNSKGVPYFVSQYTSSGKTFQSNLGVITTTCVPTTTVTAAPAGASSTTRIFLQCGDGIGPQITQSIRGGFMTANSSTSAAMNSTSGTYAFAVGTTSSVASNDGKTQCSTLLGARSVFCDWSTSVAAMKPTFAIAIVNNAVSVGLGARATTASPSQSTCYPTWPSQRTMTVDGQVTTSTEWSWDHCTALGIVLAPLTVVDPTATQNWLHTQGSTDHADLSTTTDVPTTLTTSTVRRRAAWRRRSGKVWDLFRR